MRIKHWPAALLVLALVIAAGSMALAVNGNNDLGESEAQVYFTVTGAEGVRLVVEEGMERAITLDETEFPPSQLKVEAHNVHDDKDRDVKITASTVDGGWYEKLVLGAAPEAGEIALKFSKDDVSDWGEVNWFTEAGEELTLEKSENYEKYFWIQGIVGAGTEEGTEGRVIFKAELIVD